MLIIAQKYKTFFITAYNFANY